MRRSAATVFALFAMLLSAALGARGHGRAAPTDGSATATVAPLFFGGARPLNIGRPAAHTGAGESEDCARCHSEIAREWAQSQHKTAWTDEVFQASFALEPMPFCVHCHAPLSSPRRQPSGRAASEAIGCAVCHVREQAILSSGAGRGDAAGLRAPHTVIADSRFSQSSFCAGCHQFNFPSEATPGGHLYDSHAPMQDTFGEWQQSSFAQQNVQCQDCHMPWQTTANGTRYRSHRFVGPSDATLLSQAAVVSVSATKTRDGQITVQVQVSPGRIGHAFPTGDLFRRLEMRVWLDGAEQSAQTLGYAREFSDRYEHITSNVSAFVRRQVRDTRVQPPGSGPAEIQALVFHPTALQRASITLVRWKLEHLLMPSPQAAAQGFGTALNRSTVAEGTAPIVLTPTQAGSR